MNSVTSNNLSLRCQRFTRAVCKELENLSFLSQFFFLHFHLEILDFHVNEYSFKELFNAELHVRQKVRGVLNNLKFPINFFVYLSY